MNRSRLRVACSVLVLLLVGCTTRFAPGDAGIVDPVARDAGPTDAGVGPEDLCAALAQADLEGLASPGCACSAGRAAELAAERQAICEAAPWHDWLRGGRAAFDRAAAQALLADAATSYRCEGARYAESPLVVRGYLTQGSACDIGVWWGFASECGDGLHCHGGRCLRWAAEGESCDGTAPCESGLECLGGTCFDVGYLGDYCLWYELDRCNEGLECFLGSCAEPVRDGDVGAPCERPIHCRAGLTCSTIGGTCQALAGPDAPCVEPTECRSGVCEAGRCVGPFAAGEACTPPSTADHVRCGIEVGWCPQGCVTSERCREVCEAPARCMDGVCDVYHPLDRAPLGEACAADPDCDSYTCIDDVCASRACRPD